jgi:hypothetical protein
MTVHGQPDFSRGSDRSVIRRFGQQVVHLDRVISVAGLLSNFSDCFVCRLKELYLRCQHQLFQEDREIGG